MTLTLLGDVVLGLLLTLIADRYGRRKILFGGSFLMVLSGAAFAIFENFWILLGAAIVGVVSATGGDFGPFRAIEESVLSQLTSPKTRADVLAWYVTLSTVGSAIGSEAGGRMIHGLTGLNDWSLVDAYHAIFWVYTAMGFVNALLVWFLTSACELQGSANAEYARVAQDECESVELSPRESEDVQRPIAQEDGESRTTRENAEKPKRRWTNALSQVSKISRPTRSVMYKLWFLLGVDSIADGMVPYTLTNYCKSFPSIHGQRIDERRLTRVGRHGCQISSLEVAPRRRYIGVVFSGCDLSCLCRPIGTKDRLDQYHGIHTRTQLGSRSPLRPAECLAIVHFFTAC